MTLIVHTDRRLVRAGVHSTRFVLATIQAPVAARRDQRTPVNIGIVLDRSGSMADARKFSLAREAVEQALGMLRPGDRFSLVVYDNRIDVLMPSSLATAEVKRRAVAALSEIEPRGGTNLGAGWLCGCEQISEFFEREQVNRCLLLTDGLANDGITARDELAHHAAELRQRGVMTSTFGVGADFDETLLRDMAHEGGGNFYFIEGAAQIADILTSELGEALEVTLRDVTVAVRPAGGELVTVLNRFRSRWVEDRGERRIELGDMTSGQELNVVVEVRFPRGEVGDSAAVAIEVGATGEEVHDMAATVNWTFASHAENDAQPRNREVDRAVAKLYAARARAEATEANRHGRYDRAREVLEATARRVRSYAGTDAELLGIARELQRDIGQFADAPMSAMAIKASYFVAEAASKDRSAEGRAKRANH